MKLIEVSHVPCPDPQIEDMQTAADKIITEFELSGFKRAKIEFESDDIVPAMRNFKKAVQGKGICMQQRIDGYYLLKRANKC